MLKRPYKAFCAAFFSTLLVAVSSGAQETDDDVLDDGPALQLDDETMQAVSNLAVRMSFSAVGDGTKATTATVDDNVAAILAVLQAVHIGSTSFRTVPYSGSNSREPTLGSILRKALGESWYSSATQTESTSFLYEIQRALFGQQGVPSAHDSIVQTLLRLESLASSSSGSGGVDLAGVTNALYYTDGRSWLELIEGDVHGLSFSGDRLLVDPSLPIRQLSWYDAVLVSDPFWDDGEINSSHELLVHDDDASGYLENIEYSTGMMESSLDSLLQAVDLGPIRASLEYLTNRVSRSEEAAKDTPEAFTNALESVPGGSTDYEGIDDDASDEYEDIPLPTVEDGYSPTIELSDLSSSQSDLGLSGVELPNNHNQLITLIAAHRSGYNPAVFGSMPAVEIDLGRDNAFDAGARRLGGLLQYLYGVAFSLLLGVKTVSMYRKVRLATTALAVDEKSLMTTLSWDPF